jgi:hypothetical protein
MALSKQGAGPGPAPPCELPVGDRRCFPGASPGRSHLGDTSP